MNKQVLLSVGFSLLTTLVPAAHAASTTVELWLDKCARCHGDAGAGDTPLGRKLKVVDYSSKKAQAAFTDEHLQNVIAEGRTVNGKQVMPSYKDELSSAETKALTKYIRGLAK